MAVDEGLIAPTEGDGLRLTGTDVASEGTGLELDPHLAVRMMTAMVATQHRGVGR